MTKVSVIIPNYNHLNFLEKRLKSVMHQTYGDFEVIILDDASTDGSQALLESYREHPKVTHLLFNDNNSGGPFKQWEKGIALAQGEYIWIAESDDYSEKTFLETLVPYFNAEIGIVYAQSNDVDVDGHILSNRIDYTNEFEPNVWLEDFECEGRRFISEYLSRKNVIPNASAVIFKKELVEKKGAFDDTLRNMSMLGDWLFWVRLAMQTDIAFVSTTLNAFRTHDKTSRQHQTLDKKKKRLLEERQILEFLLEKNLENSEVLKNKLYRRWFQLHSKFDIFHSGFYNIRIKDSRLNLFNKFIAFKLKRL